MAKTEQLRILDEPSCHNKQTKTRKKKEEPKRKQTEVGKNFKSHLN